MDRTCYYCGALQSAVNDRYCRECGRLLQLPPAATDFGRRYLLSRLEGLIQRGALDEASAARVRIVIDNELAGSAEPAAAAARRPIVMAPTTAFRSAAPVVTSAAPAPPPPPAPGGPRNDGPSSFELQFTPERAPSLLLYVGAFLVVVAALIFVNVSGQQISDQIRLALMIIGTLGFLGGGLACCRVQRVVEAGRTFLIIGALLVPLDFIAYYGLIARVSPFSSPAMWVVGSILAALLYATLALRGYGRVHAQFWFLACLSGLAGIDALLHVRVTWSNVPFALFVLAIELGLRIVRSGPGLRLLAPVSIPSRIVAFIALGTGVLIVALASAIDPRFPPESVVGPLDRSAMVVLAALAAVYYGLRSDRARGWERWLAAAGPGLIGPAVVFAANGDLATYGVILMLVATAYVAVAELDELADRRSPFPEWLRTRARWLGYWAIAAAILPVDSYWRRPALGAAGYLGLTALLATLGARRAMATSAVPGARASDAVAVPTVLAAGTAHAATFFLLVALGIVHVGVAPFTGVDPRDLALLITPLALALGVLTVLAHRRLPILTDVLGLSGVASGSLAVVLATSEPSLGALLGYLAVLGTVAVAFAIGRPRVLWIAAALGAVAGWSLVHWLDPPDEVRPPLIAGWAIAFFVPAFLRRFEANPFARVTREIAIVVGLGGVAIGFSSSLDAFGVDPWDTRVWLATVPAVALLGVLGVAEGLRRRLEYAVLAGTGCFLGCALMLIATLHPRAIEAFPVPIAIYLGLAALGIARLGSPQLRGDLLIATRVAATFALIAPTYLRSFGQNETFRTEIVLAEGLALLIFAGTLGFDDLVLAAVAVLGAGALRTMEDPLILERVGGVFGAAAVAYLVFVPSRLWRARVSLREAAEAVAVALVLGAPLMRASVGGSDSLEHGMVVLAGGAAFVGIALWTGRQALLAAAMVALGAMGLLALRDPASTEVYVALTGVVLVTMLYGLGGLGPSRVLARWEAALEVLAAALILSGALDRTLSPQPEARAQAWLALAEGVGLVIIGGTLKRRMLAASGAAAIAFIGLWAFGDPTARQFHAVVAGAALIAAALGAVRYRPRDVDARALVGAEIAGALCVVGPTLMATWGTAFVPGTIVVFFEVALLLGAGVVLARRWLVAVALGALGIEAIRATIDVVDRLPNWALFGASGALLLTIGFVLLIKREAWDVWSHRAYAWWIEL